MPFSYTLSFGMQDKKQSFQPVALLLTLVAAFLRLLPHPPNFTPVGAVALFGGARLRGWQACAVPLLAMLLTDPILSQRAGFAPYSWSSLIIYGCFLINVALGRVFLSHSSNPGRIAAVVLAGSTQFFLITNFASWIGHGGLYPHTFSGLVECYTLALPFFGRTILGDLFYTGVLFSVYALVSRSTHRVETKAAM